MNNAFYIAMSLVGGAAACAVAALVWRVNLRMTLRALRSREEYLATSIALVERETHYYTRVVAHASSARSVDDLMAN